MTDHSPDAVANTKRALAADLKDADFKGWQHHPVSALFFQYIADLIDVSRQNIADIVENGQANETDAPLMRNIHCLRGQIASLRDIAGLQISTIKEFYDAEKAKAEQDDQ
jgi:hypothetical protein